MSEKIRDYEVSVWTLQDSYLATLKWSNSSHKGQIQEPKMTLSDDGTESFSFSIPMHLYVQDGDRLVKKENPIWYTIRDGILMVNMRKIKVIFNKVFDPAKKEAAGERVFEFLITKITETHEEDNPTCQVECEGLAFHELGKQGYKIELSSEVFYDRDNTYYNGDADGSTIWYDNLYQPHADCPRATLDYWMHDLGIKHARYLEKTVDVITEIDENRNATKIVTCINGLDYDGPNRRTYLNPTEWYYDVQMDQSAYSQLDQNTSRQNDKVYEDPFVSSWDKDLNPMTIEPAREKERMIDANESNLYNLTQTIAENFEVLCRYEYTYNSNYQITGRKIIFYNTFHSDYNSQYFEYINYPHSASSVSREYDGIEITTKMYVRPETDDSSVTGQISIIDSNANPTKEDYVMNFDYLHDIGTISDEQYDEIKVYNLKMKHYNEGQYVSDTSFLNNGIALQDGYIRNGGRIYRQKGNNWEEAGLITLQEQLLAKQDRKIEVDAKLTVAERSYTEALERLSDAVQHIGANAQNGGTYQERTNNAPWIESISPYKDANGTEYYKLSFTDTGIFSDTIRLFKVWESTDNGFPQYTSKLTDIPDSDFKTLFSADGIDFTSGTGAKALANYKKLAKVDNDNTAKNTLNEWYNKLKQPNSSFAANEIPNFVSAKITYKNQKNVYGSDCPLAKDAIGWVLYALGYASLVKLDKTNWKKYVIQVKSPMGKEYNLKCTASTGDNKFQIDKTTWNEWVGCRLQWCLATQNGILKKDIQMKKSSDTQVVSSKFSWATLNENNTLAVSVNTNGKVQWSATIPSLGLTSATAATFKNLVSGTSVNYFDLLDKVGIHHYPNEITFFHIIADDNGNLTGIDRIKKNSGETLTKLYLTYKFDPITYYRSIRDMWEKKVASSAQDKELLSAEQDELKTSIDNLQEVIKIMLKDKFDDTRKFDHIMGPALRESYWQPEDYHDYGDFYSQRLNAILFNNSHEILPTWYDEQVSAGFFWDNELFPEEEKGYYFLGVDTGETAQKHFYPCIDLRAFFKSCDEPLIGGNDTMIAYSENSATSDMQPINAYNDVLTVVGTGILTQDVGGDSYLKPRGTEEHIAISNGNTIVNNLNTGSSLRAIMDFVANLEKLTFSYYNDNFDKQVLNTNTYSTATSHYDVNNIWDWSNYNYDQTLYAAVKGQGAQAYVQWAYKTCYIETMQVDNNKTDSKAISTEVEVARSEADRVFYTVGSLTAEGAFVENDGIQLVFMRNKNSNEIIPVLMLKCLDGVPDSVLHYLQQPINYDENSFLEAHRNNIGQYYRIHPGAQPMLGYYEQGEEGATFQKIGVVQPKHWLNTANDGYEIVYPRIKINSLQLKPSTVALTLNYDLLKQYEDYYIFTKGSNSLVTIKPIVFYQKHGASTAIIKKIIEAGQNVNDYLIVPGLNARYYTSLSSTENGNDIAAYIMGTNEHATSWMSSEELYTVEDLKIPVVNSTNYVDEVSLVADLCLLSSNQEKVQRPLRITYAISNGGTRTYLDALKVIKENSQPKVAYTITPNIENTNLISTLYNRLGQIVGINDAELKFKNVFGYISSMELDLDKPWEDSIEVKNYTNKFEDLFSSITAQTEAMKKNSGIMASLGAGNFPITLGQSIAETINETITTPMVLGNLMDAFDGEEIVEEALYNILKDASVILGSGREAINELLNLNSENASIFSAFIKNISDQTKPSVFTGDPTTITNFKPGDICYGTDGRVYVAASGDTFMPVYDGAVSQIIGATVQWDANEGTVNIEGATQIDIRSGNNIDIAANSDINIIGNKSVNIGGATINIGSAIIEGESDPVSGGINIVSSIVRNDDSETTITEEDIEDQDAEEEETSLIVSTNSDISGVFIHPEQISMLSANIIMEGADRIVMYTSDGTAEHTSAMSISTSKGIWIGTGKGIDIFANGTDLTYNTETEDLELSIIEPEQIDSGVVTEPAVYAGASVSIYPERILMGVADSENGSIVRIKSDEVIIASSNEFNTVKEINGTSSGLIGARFTPNSIGFATSNNSSLSAILMDAQGITFGGGIGGTVKKTINGAEVVEPITLLSSTEDLQLADGQSDGYGLQGSYVRISADGITLGSMANMYINTNNFKMQTKSNGTIFAVGTDLQSSGAIGDQGVGIAFVGGTLTVKGIIQAESLILSSNAQATMENIITGKVSGTYIGNLGFYTKTEIDGKNYTTLAAVGNRIWAELKGEGNDGSVQHTGWSITSSGMSITSTGVFTVSAGNFQLDSSSNINIITSTGTATQNYYITNVSNANKIGYILAQTITPDGFDENDGDGEGNARAFSGGQQVTGIGIFASDGYGVFSYPHPINAPDNVYGGILVNGNCDIQAGLRVGGYNQSTRRGTLITRSYIKTDKIYIDTSDMDSVTQPRIIFQFERNMTVGNKTSAYEFQAKLYLATAEDGAGDLRYAIRRRLKGSNTWPDWPQSGNNIWTICNVTSWT